MTTLRTLLVLLAAFIGGPAWAEDTSNDGIAQDDSSSDDELGDILGGPTGEGEGSSSEETRDFEESTSDPTDQNVILVENDGNKNASSKPSRGKTSSKKVAGRHPLTLHLSRMTPSSIATSWEPESTTP